VRGRVLDIGAGAGRHSLEAQSRGLEVVAIDVSPGALAVCRRRGVRDARPLALAEIGPELGLFDTALLMCGNLGLAGSAESTREMLGRLHALTRPQGRIVFDSVDPHVGNDEADLAYLERNALRGRMPGEVTIRIRYGEIATPWFELLCVSPAELESLLPGTGWSLAWAREDEPDWYGVLEKA
jgi:SAM-dependent methyltransferase